MTKIEEFWVDATAEDVAEIMKTGKLAPARFKDLGTDDWCEHSLAGWKLRGSGDRWLDSNGMTWHICQVYREPSWYKNKPDPGPEYRLLRKFPDEPVRGGDFIYGSDGVWVDTSPWCNPSQLATIWYRRRIEPVEPVESKPLLIRRRVVEIGDEIKLPNGRVLVFNGEGFEVVP